IAGGDGFAVRQQENEIHSTFQHPFLDDLAALQAPRLDLLSHGTNKELLAGAEAEALSLVRELEGSAKSPIAAAPDADFSLVIADERAVVAKENARWIAMAFDGLQCLSRRGIQELK